MRRLLLGVVASILVACSTPSTAPAPKRPVRVTTGAAWYRMRAQQLGMSMEEAKARDAELGAEAPPNSEVWDPTLAKETATLWQALCEECHGGRRTIEHAAELPAPEPGWGEGNAQLFGRDRPLADAWRLIYDGSEDKKKMPAWGKKLANEQIWFLLYYVEKLSADATSKVHLEKE